MPASVSSVPCGVRSNSRTPRRCLQTLDLATQRRLCHVQLGGRPAEVQLLGDDREVPHQPQFEVDAEVVHASPQGGCNPGADLGYSSTVIPFRHDEVPTRSWTARADDGRRLDGMGRYDGKKVVITGGSSGLGLAAAQHLVDDGARVLITGRTQETLDDRRQSNSAAARSPSRATRVRSSDIDALADRVQAEFGTVDALFVNAGIGSFDPFDAVTEQTFDEVFAINVKGPFFTVQKLAPLLAEGSGVVLTTSIANQTGWDALSVYSASKAALRSMARTLSKELLPQRHSGQRDQPRLDRHRQAGEGSARSGPPRSRPQFTASNPMRRLGHPDEFAPAVAFLAFDATFVAGIELVVDGGESQSKLTRKEFTHD